MKGYDCIQLQTILGVLFDLYLDRGVFRLGERLSGRKGWTFVVVC